MPCAAFCAMWKLFWQNAQCRRIDYNFDMLKGELRGVLCTVEAISGKSQNAEQARRMLDNLCPNCKGAPICTSTAYQGAKTLYIHPIWMWDAVYGGLGLQ